MKKLILILIIALLAGCASVGRKLDVTAVDKVVKGQSKQEVTALIGSPDSKATSMNSFTGQTIEVWVYSFMTYESSPANFIPVVGALAGSAQMQQELLTITFDGSGMVDSKMFSQTQNQMNSGLITQPSTTLPDVQLNKRPE
jgi:outer membrane protein assembly factor BamE (lipoprotein component of BamABCDE complex)